MGGEYVLAHWPEAGGGVTLHLLAQLSDQLLGTHQPIWSLGHCPNRAGELNESEPKNEGYLKWVSFKVHYNGDI